MEKISRIRNIGISAHIDSGKTTLSERILYYAGRIHRMQEVRGEGTGATMDFMDLERERGITITSASTQVIWKDRYINLIDTPGHVDFTVEVERSLRVLDGAIMVLCSVGGVQSQSFTVDQQMKRYRVPRIAFINKMDRTGADPERVCKDMREKLGLNVVPLQIQLGQADNFQGVVDLITMEAVTFEGDNGEKVVRSPVWSDYTEAAQIARQEMLEALSMYNDEMMTLLLEDKPVDEGMIRSTIREATINRDIVPVMMGSAFKNKGVQLLMDAVCDYLPSPLDRCAFARDHDNGGTETPLAGDPDAPLVAMAFKIADETYGQLTYTRIYQGRIEKGKSYRNARTNKMQRIGRIVRMHANDREDISDAGPGDIIALIGVDCASGDTFCGEGINYSLESIYVANPVISLSITPASSADQDRMAKALSRFMKEDPTFRVHSDPETGQTIIAGMGELHLDIYVERMHREFKANVTVGQPNVSYREAPTIEADFNYKHKKQTGGAGQYAHVVGRLIPLPTDADAPYEFEDNIVSGHIPSEYIPAVNKGFQEAMKKGPLAGYEITGVKMCLNDGSFHPVDSSEMAFRICARDAFHEAFKNSKPCLLEPIMKVEVETPAEYQGAIVGDLNSRRGMIMGAEQRGPLTVVRAEVPLASMFGYATVVRGLSKGMATFTMEMCRYAPVPNKLAEEIIFQRRQAQQAARK
ncbi:MAG TPA: elongation factor G [Anaerohalosphaeraceae bacterium]|nr:elongation factor G [Anaerohalosphaeraceae bacterium]HPC65015.1 elongation factor G [Anaerohalosphaeraceae bacterium]HRS72113.1 elongation factor G [Anaerohalosphaeraceae bacterium]HRV21089.1 elongation factor G [Anaerohalosphaeraceae bacterium]